VTGKELKMFGKLLSAVVEVAKLPVDVVGDVVTMGMGVDDKGSHIKRRVERVQDKLEEMDD
jgi:hypothetical protein